MSRLSSDRGSELHADDHVHACISFGKEFAFAGVRTWRGREASEPLPLPVQDGARVVQAMAQGCGRYAKGG
jgi:hypothetical protein